ncbi:hypothetical protein B0J11DRAFT_581640 [Dendryphion nanum]|uniref:Uncharacterized protein n=1 Tax=Dendryphion nanum TaxID=256645 RepID=A0A9P9II03_9PLEO|nr:hypothetical protein B0J11DRAFT_581640 [Dendryphion nanum]
MKSTYTIVTLALATSGLAAPSEKRQAHTSFTLFSAPRGDGGRSITFDLPYGETGCVNFKNLREPGWNDAAFAAAANTGDLCFLHEDECNVQNGLTITIKGRFNDLGLLNGKASSVTCYKDNFGKRQLEQTNVLLCKEKRCTGFEQLDLPLILGNCKNIPELYNNKVIAVKANGRITCDLHDGTCNAPGLTYPFSGEVNDLTLTPIGTNASSIICKRS